MFLSFKFMLHPISKRLVNFRVDRRGGLAYMKIKLVKILQELAKTEPKGCPKPSHGLG